MKTSILTACICCIVLLFGVTETVWSQTLLPCELDQYNNPIINDSCNPSLTAQAITSGGSGTTLNTMLNDIYSVLGDYIIPFLVSIAFIAFIVNIIRFFILKSDSDEGREKARRYLVWSLIGFVLILAMWGIINLIIIIFGFNTFGGIVCPDYDPTCNPSGIAIGPTPSPGGGFTGGGPVVPNDPGVIIGSSDPITGIGSIGGLGNPGGSDIPPNIPGSSVGDYSNVGAGVQSRVANTLGVPDTFLSNQLANISTNGVTDNSRLITALSFANAGAITQPELSQIVVDVNQIRQSHGELPISLSNIVTNPQYVNDIKIIYQNLPAVKTHLVNYYLSNGLPTPTAQNMADADMQNIFRTNNTFATRVNTASNIMLNVMEGDPQHPAFIPLLLALNAEAHYAGCNVIINSTNLFQAPCG